MSGYKLEGHKLHLHPGTINEWYKGNLIAPIYVEIGPTSICNHRCKMCAYDYMEHQSNSIDAARLVSLMSELADVGVKSVCFAGDGEPLLNKGTVDAICFAKENGLDVSLSTNGALCTEEILQKILPALTWIRFSVNGGTAETYGAVHGTDLNAYHKVISTLGSAAKIKKDLNLKVTLGVQYVLLPENVESVYCAAKDAKNSKVDYFVVKPFYQNAENQYFVNNFSMLDYANDLKKVEELSDEKFSSIVRWETENTNFCKRQYSECYGLSFISIIAASGCVFPCLPHQTADKSFGNINESSFSEILNGQQRMKVLEIMKKLDKNTCQPNCRHHWINNYLWEIKNPPAHKNFI